MKKQTRMGLSLLVVFLLVLTTFTGFIPSTGVNAQENVQASGQIIDIQGHWAQAQIADWVEKGLARGYNDGTFKPDKSITRAEFITLVNKAFGFTKKSQINFKDVSTADWYSEEIAKAAAEGYITGYEDGTIKPGNEITRQEVAVILSKIMKLKTDETKATDKFKDASRIPAWSKPYIDTIVRNGYIGGYPDGTIQPSRSISRAESIIMLDRAIGTLYNAAGTYGPSDGENSISGNVTINTTGVTLQNTVIEGNLYLTAGIGDGDVYLNNVVVKGKTIVAGGGENSIHFTNFTGGEIIVIKVGGQVRIVAAGDTRIDQVQFESGGTVEGQGISEVYVLKPGEEVILNGDFEKVVLEANAEVKVTDKTTIEKLEIADTAKQAKVDIAENCTVKTLTLNAPARITGKGKIEKAQINADGAVIEQKPEKVEVAEGVKANVGGKEVSGGTTTSSGGSGGGGSSGGGGGSTQPSKAAINSITVTNGTITVAFSKTVTGLTLNDFNITAKLDEQTYILKNLTYNDSTKTFTFTPIPQTNKLQTLAITVAAASSSTKITGSDSDTVTIEALPEEKGSIEGTVTSAVYGEGPIEGATITILNTDFSVTTDVYGKYSISNIPVGTYSIKAAKAGYQAQTKEVQVENGKTTTVDFELEKEEAGDTTPPIFVETYPKIENVAQTSFDLVVEINETAILYYAVLPEGGEAPTAEQVKNIIDFIDSGHFVYVDGKYSWLQPNESCRITISSQNFEPGKTYYVYVVAEDAAQNLQAEPVKLTVTLAEAEPQNSTINPNTAVFDKNTSSADYKDIAVTMTLNGNTLIAIKNGETELTANTDYTVEDNVVTFKKEYLAAQAVGNITLTFEFSAGNPATLIVTVSDSAPLEAAFEAVNSFGIHDGKVYAGYELQDKDGKQIALVASNIENMTVKNPDESTDTLTVGDDSDPYLWFNVEKTAGTYEYTVTTKDGKVYTAKLAWNGTTAATFNATNRQGEHNGVTYKEYELLKDSTRISLAEGAVKLIASKDGQNWTELTPNTDETLWFNIAHESGTYEFLVVTSGNVIYKATLAWTAPVVPEAASFVPANSFGIHDGKVYAGYELKDEAGKQIALVASNIESMTVLEPGANEPKTLTVGDDSDPYLWFNVEKAEGNYLYTVLTKDGITYEATLTWAAPKTATWEETGGEGVHDGITYVEYKLMDGENQVSLKEGEVKLIASKGSEGKWVALEPNTDETLWFNKAHETGDYEFIVVTKDNTIYKATLEWTAPVVPEAATFEPTGGIGDHEGKIYKEYELKAGGEVISLKKGDVTSITVEYPDGSTKDLTANTDSTLWFNIDNETGAYVFTVETNDGTVYEATLEWIAPQEAKVSFKAPAGAEAVFTVADDANPAQVDFSQVTADKLHDWTSVEPEYYAIELEIEGVNLSATNVKKAFRVYEDGSIIEPEISGDLNVQYVTTKWQTGTATMYYVLQDDSIYKAVINVVSLTPAPEVETIAADVDYNAVWNPDRGTWYIKVTVPGEDLDVDSVTSISVIKEAGEELETPRPLQPDTDKVLWFSVALADGDTALKANGEYAYEVVRSDGSKYIFNFTYDSSEVQGIEEVTTTGELVASESYPGYENWSIAITEAGIDFSKITQDQAIKMGIAEPDYYGIALDLVVDEETIALNTENLTKVKRVKPNGEVEEPLITETGTVQFIHDGWGEAGEYTMRYYLKDGRIIEATINVVSFEFAPAQTTSLTITAPEINTVAGRQFDLPVTTKGTVGEDHANDMVRFYANIAGLIADNIELGEVPGLGTPAVINDGSDGQPLVLAWGPENGFQLSDHKAEYESADGLTTTFPVTIDKAGSYTVNYSLKTVEDNPVEIANGSSSIEVVEPAPVAATFEPTDNIGDHEGKVYEEYRLKADGKVIDLSAGNIKSIKVVEPDATEAKELTPNTDSTLWFNVQKLSGDYKYTVVDNNDITYTATLTWTAPEKVTAVATGNEGEHNGNYYVEYKLGDLDLSSFDKMYQIKPDGTVIELTANTDQNLWFKTTGQIPGTHTFLVKKDGAWYVAEIEWTAATEAAFEAVNSFGIHDGKVYAGYELQDEAGNQIALVASNIESITVKNPDGSTATLTVVDDSDPYLWFNVEKTAGDYVYTVVTKGGKTYEATLTWAAPKTATWEATNREGVHDGITYVEYKLMDGENQVSLKEGEVKLIASKDSEGKWVALEPNTDETLWFNKAHETGNYEFIVVTNANTIYKATLAWT